MNIIDGTKASDVLYGDQNDNNLINGRGASDQISGGKLADTLLGGNSGDGVWGDTGDDKLIGGTGNDVLQGSEGNDTLVGGEGSDRLFGGKHDDVLLGGKGDDILNGNSGDDHIVGNSGDDVVLGTSGNDVLDGANGSDLVHGGSGDDLVMVSTGYDHLAGGSGFDTIDFTGIVGKVDIDLGKHSATFSAGPQHYTQSVSGFEQVIANGAGAHIMGDDSHGSAIVGGAGDDWMRGKAGDDVLTGGDGYDTFAYLKKDTAGGSVDTITDFKVGQDRLDMSDFLKGHADYADVVRLSASSDGVMVQGKVHGVWTDVASLAGIDANDIGADHHQMTIADLGLLAA